MIVVAFIIALEAVSRTVAGITGYLSEMVALFAELTVQQVLAFNRVGRAIFAESEINGVFYRANSDSACGNVLRFAFKGEDHGFPGAVINAGNSFRTAALYVVQAAFVILHVSFHRIGHFGYY